MRPRVLHIAIPLLIAAPLTSRACEPILPILQLLSGSSLIGPLLFSQSILWLAAAVGVKCGAFVFFERRLPWRRAVFFMFLANVLSTIPGVLLAQFTASISGIILAVPLVCFLGIMVGRRIALGIPPNQKRYINGVTVTAAFVAFFFVSILTYQMAEDALASNNFALHWTFKLLFVAIVATTGIVISAALEEFAVNRMSRKSHGNMFFYRSVVRANYVTLGLVLAVAAIPMLPKRLNAPHFIASWVQSLAAAVGLT